MTEQWKPVVGFEGILAVSNFGNVCNIGRMLPDGTYLPEKQRKISTHHTGYTYIVQRINGKQVFLLIHRLVAEAFIPNPSNLPEVNHKDRNKSNCKVTNLEWCTRKENMKHYSREYRKTNSVYTRAKNTDIPGGKPKRAVVAINSLGEETYYESVNACARALEGFSTNVSACLKGKIKSYKGYTFKYV